MNSDFAIRDKMDEMELYDFSKAGLSILRYDSFYSQEYDSITRRQDDSSSVRKLAQLGLEIHKTVYSFLEYKYLVNKTISF